MRLAQLTKDGGFSLTTFSKANIPRYAILSHTWGKEEEEVTFEDLKDGKGTDKEGYQKLQFCGNQAKNDDLLYFWVDTCCIDKSNQHELTNAINSMFKWYQNAARCYVYLSDVSTRTYDGQSLHSEWISAFRNSRWFTRGWTLQELLAPKIVIFYSRDQVRLGDKKSLESQICEATGIDLEALRGRSLSDFSIDERFSWGLKRHTTEEEDMAYCLLGIFNVNLPLIPGEGQSSAMRRLRREIQQSTNSEISSTAAAPRAPATPPAGRNPPSIPRKSDKVAHFATQRLNKKQFADYIIKSGIAYYGDGAGSIEAELLKKNVEEAFVLYFTDELRLQAESWAENFQLLRKISDDTSAKRMIAVVDCDATGVQLDQIRISQFRRGFLAIQDVLHQTKHGACFARCRENQGFSKYHDGRPLQRSPVKIPCPGTSCEQGVACDWVCPDCRTPLEFGAEDQNIYCDCGHGSVDNYEFKCNDFRHGSRFQQFQKGLLLQCLQSLRPSQQVNILIVGETGVGKSTFINAFVNYLSHETLDEAIKSPKLEWVVPSSFSVQSISDRDSEIIQRDIKIGERFDEVDGSTGASATQKTKIYPITLGDATVRLIDTPGIGDTRGIEMDKKNMADILAVLEGFDELHGILFLMRCNQYRLTIVFRYVIKELLTHLHRNASANIAFGFTHTRISNYTPGDTFGALKGLLGGEHRADLELSRHNVYCFDSESFRFLAGYKNGFTIGNIQDFRRSWEESKSEVQRLIQHFRSLAPYTVKGSMKLSRINRLIVSLRQSMVDIMQTIEAWTVENTQEIQGLSAIKRQRDQLRARLVSKDTMQVKEDLRRNDSEIALKQASIENRRLLIDNGKYEYNEILDALIRFGIHLKQSSISPYNEGEGVYLDHLIERRREQIQAGGDNGPLETLLNMRQEYSQRVKFMNDAIHSGSIAPFLDEAGMDDLIAHLYSLKRWGKSLQMLEDQPKTISLRHNREQPYRPHRKDQLILSSLQK